MYLSPLSISLASEATLNARIDWRRPKLALCDDVNLDDSVTPPETEVGFFFNFAFEIGYSFDLTFKIPEL